MVPPTLKKVFKVFEPKWVDSLLYTTISFFNHGTQGTATGSQLSFVPPEIYMDFGWRWRYTHITSYNASSSYNKTHQVLDILLFYFTYTYTHYITGGREMHLCSKTAIIGGNRHSWYYHDFLHIFFIQTTPRQVHTLPVNEGRTINYTGVTWEFMSQQNKLIDQLHIQEIVNIR